MSDMQKFYEEGRLNGEKFLNVMRHNSVKWGMRLESCIVDDIVFTILHPLQKFNILDVAFESGDLNVLLEYISDATLTTNEVVELRAVGIY